MKKNTVLEARFSAAHFYHQKKWSQEKNQSEFGKCFTPYGHGHNYRLLAEWEKVADQDLANLRVQLDQVISKIDHEHINFVVPEFKDKVPTTENLCEYLRTEIEKSISHKLVGLELFEDDDIGAQYLRPSN